MTSETQSHWQRTLEDVVDQRGVKLPPAWARVEARGNARSERGEAVFESGRKRELAGAIVDLLDRAEQKAVVSSFLLADEAVEDALLDAARRGVRGYVLLASEARLEREPGDGEFDKMVLEQHEAMLARLGGHVLFRSAPHFHTKVVVVDPDTAPAGMLLTANLTKEALERNDELGVVLSPEEVAGVTQYLRWAMWESAEHELVDPADRFQAARPLGAVSHPEPAQGIVATTPEASTIRAELIRLIDQAQTALSISSFGWDADHAVVERLCARARDGVAVTVLARVRPASMTALLALAEAGCTVLGFRWLHAKAICTDKGEAMVMSANLQTDGLDRGFELGVRLEGERAAELRDRLRAWQESAPWRLLHRPTLGDLGRTARLWHDAQLVDVEIETAAVVDLGRVTATSADDLDAPRPPIPDNGELPRMAHEVRYSWAVAAPSLAAKSKEQRPPAKDGEKAGRYELPVFREPGGRVVVAVGSPSEIERARTMLPDVGASAIVVAAGAGR